MSNYFNRIFILKIMKLSKIIQNVYHLFVFLWYIVAQSEDTQAKGTSAC